MLDGDDVGDFAIIFMPTTIPGLVAWLIVLGILAAVVYNNQEECAQHECPNGAPAELLDNRCLCVEEAP